MPDNDPHRSVEPSSSRDVDRRRAEVSVWLKDGPGAVVLAVVAGLVILMLILSTVGVI